MIKNILTKKEIKALEKRIHEEKMKDYPQPIRDMIEGRITLNQCRVEMGFKPIPEINKTTLNFAVWFYIC